MPTYQYACTECGEQLEAVQKFSDAPLTVCDACGGKLRKVFSPVGIVFKGSGFYRTDSRNGSSAAAAKAKESGKDSPASVSASGDSAASTSGDSSKPAEKATAGSSTSSTSSSSSSSSSAGEKVA